MRTSPRSLGTAAVLWISAALIFLLFEWLAAAAVQQSVPERGSVYSILAWQAFTGVVLLARPKRAD